MCGAKRNYVTAAATVRRHSHGTRKIKLQSHHHQQQQQQKHRHQQQLSQTFSLHRSTQRLKQDRDHFSPKIERLLPLPPSPKQQHKASEPLIHTLPPKLSRTETNDSRIDSSMGKLSNLSVMATVLRSPTSLPRHDGLSVPTFPSDSDTKLSYLRTRSTSPQQHSCAKGKKISTLLDTSFPSSGYYGRKTYVIKPAPVGGNDTLSTREFKSTLHIRCRRKRGSTDSEEERCLSLLNPKRKRADDDEDASSSWTRGKDLSPVSCDLAHVVPVRDDQRQTEMEMQSSHGSPSAPDILPAPVHSITITSLSARAIGTSGLINNNINSSNSNQRGSHHHPTTRAIGLASRYPDNARQHSGQSVSLMERAPPGGQSLHLPTDGGATELRQILDFGRDTTGGDHDEREEIAGRYTDVDLEKGMREFLSSQAEASRDVTHPWHDVMSSDSLGLGQGYYGDNVQHGYDSRAYHTTLLPEMWGSNTQVDRNYPFMVAGDVTSQSTQFYNAEAWRRSSDSAYGGSISPNGSTSSSDSHHHHHHQNQQYHQHPSTRQHPHDPRNDLSTLGRSAGRSSSNASSVGGSSSAASPTAASPPTSASSSVALEPLPEEGRMMLDAVNGFLLVLDSDARVLFVSENVTEHLGVTQADLLGQNIKDYIHAQDIKELQDHMNDQQFVTEESGKDLPTWMTRRMFYLGMKFSFYRPGTRARETGYSLVQWNAKLRLGKKRNPGDGGGGGGGDRDTDARRKRNDKKGAASRRGRHRAQKARRLSDVPSSAAQGSAGLKVKTMIVLCRPVRTEAVLEIRMDGNMFISRHDLGFHFIFCDPRVETLIGYVPSDMLGRTAYQFHSPWDAIICKHCAKQLILSGTASSGYYRFLSRTGAWVWMVTQATIVYDTRRCPQYIVCKNHVVSPQLAERDLSRERKDYDMMRYPGFSMETDLPLAFTSSAGSALANAIGGGPYSNTSMGFGKGFGHDGTISLGTLRPRLGDIDPNVMLEQIFGSEQVDVSSNPYSLPRVKRTTTAPVVQTGSADAGFDRDPGSSCGTYTASSSHHRTPPTAVENVQGDVNMSAQEASDGYDIVDDDIGISGNPPFLSEQGGENEPDVRPPSPILTSLWRRDDHDSELISEQLSAATRAVQMDTGLAADVITPLPSYSGGYDPSGQDGIGLSFSGSGPGEEDPMSQRDPFPILTTTNIYSFDFPPALSDTFGAEFGSLPPFLDAPQSIPLSNATSFSDGQDFMYPSGSMGNTTFFNENFPVHRTESEYDNCERMDTPVCFDTQALDGEREDFNTVFSSGVGESSQPTYSSPLSIEKGSICQDDMNDTRLKETKLHALLTETPKHSSFTPTFDNKKSSDTQNVNKFSDSNNEMSMDGSPKGSSRPDKISILQNTSFQDGKLLDIKSTGNKMFRIIVNKSPNVNSHSSLTEQSKVQIQAAHKSDRSFPTSQPHQQSRSSGSIPTAGNNVKASPDLRLSETTQFSLPATPGQEQTAPGTSKASAFLNRGTLEDLEMMMEEDETVTPSSHPSTLGSHNQGSFHSTGALQNKMMHTTSSSGMHSAINNGSGTSQFGSLQRSDPSSSQIVTVSDSQMSIASPSLSPSYSPTAQLSGLSDSASSSSDSENSGRPSLLRTLLNKEGAAIHGPLTYTEWILQQTLEKKSQMKNMGMNTLENSTNNNSMPTAFKRSANKRSRLRRGQINKSTELPLPKASHSTVMRYGKDTLFHRKPTRELPLPPLVAASKDQSSVGPLNQRSPFGNKESGSNFSEEDFLLSDDLLDLAVEYCGSLGAEQTDALLSDFTDNPSFEESLYSLVGSPAQTKTNIASRQSQHKTDSAKVVSSDCSSLHSSSNLFGLNSDASFNNYFTGSSVTQSISDHSTSFQSPSVLTSPTADSPCSNSETGSVNSDSAAPFSNNIGDHIVPNISTNSASSSNGHMSLLRAAVTTPDVDKLIKQIPFGSHGRYSSNGSPPPSQDQGQGCSEPEVTITKVVGVKEATGAGTTRGRSFHGKIFKVPGNQTDRHIHGKPPLIPPSVTTTSGHLDAILSDHVYTASVINPQATPAIATSSTSSPSVTDTTPASRNRKQSVSPKIVTNSTPSSRAVHDAGTAISSNGHISTASKQRCSPTSRIKSTSNNLSKANGTSSSIAHLSSSATTNNLDAKTSGGIKTDLSSTEPVSVMIMRKESHRSRRSKTIAVQTENAPGEVYPEFKRSPSDTILYARPRPAGQHPANGSPSCASRRDDHVISPSATSPCFSSRSSTPAHSPPSMSQLERFLRGSNSSSEDGADAVITSPEGSADLATSSSPRSGPATPFLQRLLTGELSRDNYRRLDEEMRETERRQSSSSGSDLEWV